MKEHKKTEQGKQRHHCGEGHRRSEHCEHKGGAKTFRRGRAISFLEQLNIKRETLKQQLVSSELQTINPIIIGELKAIELVINEFVQLFELHEFESLEGELPITEEKTDADEIG